MKNIIDQVECYVGFSSGFGSGDEDEEIDLSCIQKAEHTGLVLILSEL